MSGISGASGVSFNWLPQGFANISSGSTDWLTAGASSDPFSMAAEAFASIQQTSVANIGSLVATEANSRLQADAVAKLFDKKI